MADDGFCPDQRILDVLHRHGSPSAGNPRGVCDALQAVIGKSDGNHNDLARQAEGSAIDIGEYGAQGSDPDGGLGMNSLATEIALWIVVAGCTSASETSDIERPDATLAQNAGSLRGIAIDGRSAISFFASGSLRVGYDGTRFYLLVFPFYPFCPSFPFCLFCAFPGIQ
jgi:hypothetical protein